MDHSDRVAGVHLTGGPRNSSASRDRRKRGTWWVPAGALTAVPILLLTIGACEGSTAPEPASAEDEFAALVEEVGPDWQVVDEFHDRQREWSERFRELSMSDVSEESLEELAREQPDISRAAAAATAILDAGRRAREDDSSRGVSRPPGGPQGRWGRRRPTGEPRPFSRTHPTTKSGGWS